MLRVLSLEAVNFSVGFLSVFRSLLCRRKRGEKGEVVETVEDLIVRKLTAERVEEVKKLIKETQEKYRYWTC